MNPKRENAGRISGEFRENFGRKQGKAGRNLGEVSFGISIKNTLKGRFSLKTTYICSELLPQNTLISTGKCILPEFIQVKNRVNIFEEVSLFHEGTLCIRFDKNEPKQLYHF